MKLAIFDKDGTLTTPASDAEFVQHPEDQILLPGVSEGVAAMAADGWTIAIASNQGGVAAGYKS
ncbi:MAG TPA: HAD family hydrolase, partial [Candidatus Paceibacterota bacterium]|nr:HAD family hydrolase [Candidatus Paceibacterota bacterium]